MDKSIIARATGNVVKNDCPDCEETLLFEFTDESGTFTMGLSAVISAISTAGKHDKRFEIPDEWERLCMQRQEN